MESSSSSISELPPNQRRGEISKAPLMAIESNRPFFLAVCTKIICELDPIFVAEHFDELEEHWTLQDGIVKLADNINWTVILGLPFSNQAKKNKKLFWVAAISVYITRADKDGVAIVRHIKKDVNPLSVNQLIFSGKHLSAGIRIGLISGMVALTEDMAVGRTFAAMTIH
ncbi:high affinity sulfate transporter [Medicago truncatula]|uniref:High affinity sulfate transporter n=1 Tax=Medicago truncatula TaxID=3880 RepID=A0A072U6W3_MEDTR|nr:high affinity sulfate transporter [Medicago truncatula]